MHIFSWEFRGALSGIESPQQTLIKTDKTSQCSSSLTLKDHYNQEQRDQPKQKHQSRTVTKSTDPSEEDLSRGVFTEVSFAGTFASSQKPTPIQKQERSKLDAPVSLPIDFEAPVPSPRLKRKARKEQMLKEHKETGREALSLLVKNFQSNKYEDGNALLDDLCHHGAEVEKDICEERKLFETMRKQTNKVRMDLISYLFLNLVCFSYPLRNNAYEKFKQKRFPSINGSFSFTKKNSLSHFT